MDVVILETLKLGVHSLLFGQIEEVSVLSYWWLSVALVSKGVKKRNKKIYIVRKFYDKISKSR